MNIDYYYFFGIFSLLWLTWQDYRNNKFVDDRRNWFMMGIAISLISHIDSSILYRFAVIIIAIALNMAFRRLKTLGNADINSLSWIFMGLAFINIFYLILFCIIFCSLTLLFTLLKKYVFKIKEATQFYGVLLLSFTTTALLIML
jgi:hypothetical protein